MIMFALLYLLLEVVVLLVIVFAMWVLLQDPRSIGHKFGIVILSILAVIVLLAIVGTVYYFFVCQG